MLFILHQMQLVLKRDDASQSTKYSNRIYHCIIKFVNILFDNFTNLSRDAAIPVDQKLNIPRVVFRIRQVVHSAFIVWLCSPSVVHIGFRSTCIGLNFHCLCRILFDNFSSSQLIPACCDEFVHRTCTLKLDFYCIRVHFSVAL